MDMNLSKLRETEKDREAWHNAVHGVAKNWTEQLTTPVFWPGESMDRGAWQATVHGVAKSRT